MTIIADCEANPVRCIADNGEHADFWLLPKPGDDDRQKAGLLFFSVLRGLSSAMKGQRRAGVSCDIHPTSLIVLIGEARGVAVGPVVYAPNTCSGLIGVQSSTI